MIRPLQSLRWRLQAWYALILLLVLGAFLGLASRVAGDAILRRNDQALTDAERLVGGAILAEVFRGNLADIGDSNVLRGRLLAFGPLPETLTGVFRGRDPGYLYFAILAPSGEVLLQSDNAPSDLEPLTPARIGEPAEDLRFVGQDRRELRRTMPQIGFTMIVGRDILPERDAVRKAGGTLLGVGIGIWLLGLSGGWWIAGRAIAPIQDISRTATRIADGNLAERIDAGGAAQELRQLSAVLNQTFARLQEAFEQQKRFTADAAHELRTPVTILLSETERILRRERSPEEYRQVIHACHTAAVRMRGLTEALLTLARLEARGAASANDAVDLALIARDSLAQHAPLADERRITLFPDLGPAPCRGDAAALLILINNLVANAIQHHRPGGNVHVTTKRSGTEAILTVADNGPGIAEADQPHVFERFYRADKARSSASGHTGLGLAIVKSIVDNHGGAIEVTSRPGEGARFVVRLPVG